MQDATVIQGIASRYASLSTLMDERMRRQWAAAEARSYGWGGIRAVSRATGLSPNTISKGLVELETHEANPSAPRSGRLRKPGAGRQRACVADPGLAAALERLVDPVTRGDPQSPLRWTCKSTTQLARELTRQGHPVSPRTVGRLLKASGYSLQGNRKTKEGADHPDRNAQFEHINGTVADFQKRGQPVISVDTKKKELVGQFRNGGREWHRKREPIEVRVHDFMDKELGKAIPYGVYDLANNEGWVSVGITHDTAEFAAATVRRWWDEMGHDRFGNGTELLITADGGGSNGARSRLWKVALQQLADTTGLTLTVCHFPPGTSKWNKIEHRLFSFITQNWRGKPLITVQAIVQLIGNTRTATGLTVRAALDPQEYPSGKKVSNHELKDVHLKKHKFHGEWNYTIRPRRN